MLVLNYMKKRSCIFDPLCVLNKGKWIKGRHIAQQDLAQHSAQWSDFLFFVCFFYIAPPLNKESRGMGCISGCVCCPLVILLPSCKHLRPTSAEKHSSHASVFSNTTQQQDQFTVDQQDILSHFKWYYLTLKELTLHWEMKHHSSCVCVCVVVGESECRPSVDTENRVLLLPTSA